MQCTGGDFSLPGAEMQDLHADMPARAVADQLYGRNPLQPSVPFMELPTPAVKVYFPMVDLSKLSGHCGLDKMQG